MVLYTTKSVVRKVGEGAITASVRHRYIGKLDRSIGFAAFVAFPAAPGELSVCPGYFCRVPLTPDWLR